MTNDIFEFDEHELLYKLDENEEYHNNDELINLIIQNQFYECCNLINECINKLENPIFIIEGSMGLWNGNVNVNQIVKIECFKDDFIFKYLELDNSYLYIKFNCKTLEITVKKYHHDGTNYYELKPLQKLTRQELQDLLLSYFDKRELDEYIRNYDGISFSKRTKSDLIDLIELVMTND
jgi:hypothetical protein